MIFKNDNAITARMVDYKHTEQRINAAISAVIDTGLKLADFDLSRIADKDFICSEAQRQAIQNAQAHTPYPITAEHVDTRTWREQLTEICTQLTKEMRSLKVRLDYFTFSDGRACKRIWPKQIAYSPRQRNRRRRGGWHKRPKRSWTPIFRLLASMMSAHHSTSRQSLTLTHGVSVD